MRFDKHIGLRVKANHPRGGHIEGVVVKAERERGRGHVLTLNTGHSIVVQDIIAITDPPKGWYVTTYCNFAHSMKDGRPIGHECRCIPVAALRLERQECMEEAMELMQQASLPPIAKGEFRVSYMLDGRSMNTGVFYAKSKAEDALAAFKRWTKAWLQVKNPNDEWETKE